jgi:hypothetical protein
VWHGTGEPQHGGQVRKTPTTSVRRLVSIRHGVRIDQRPAPEPYLVTTVLSMPHGARRANYFVLAPSSVPGQLAQM